jgi:hypothetical protein
VILGPPRSERGFSLGDSETSYWGIFSVVGSCCGQILILCLHFVFLQAVIEIFFMHCEGKFDGESDFSVRVEDWSCVSTCRLKNIRWTLGSSSSDPDFFYLLYLLHSSLILGCCWCFHSGILLSLALVVETTHPTFLYEQHSCIYR